MFSSLLTSGPRFQPGGWNGLRCCDRGWLCWDRRCGAYGGAVFLCESSGKPEEEMHTSENQSGWVSCDSTAAVEETAYLGPENLARASRESCVWKHKFTTTGIY